jgi:hypothetical protein
MTNFQITSGRLAHMSSATDGGYIAANSQRRILGFYAFYRSAFVTLTPALSSSFWDAVAAGSTALAGTTRRIYNGNGQTYTSMSSPISSFSSLRVAFVSFSSDKSSLPPGALTARATDVRFWH